MAGWLRGQGGGGRRGCRRAAVALRALFALRQLGVVVLARPARTDHARNGGGVAVPLQRGLEPEEQALDGAGLDRHDGLELAVADKHAQPHEHLAGERAPVGVLLLRVEGRGVVVQVDQPRVMVHDHFRAEHRVAEVAREVLLRAGEGQRVEPEIHLRALLLTAHLCAQIRRSYSSFGSSMKRLRSKGLRPPVCTSPRISS